MSDAKKIVFVHGAFHGAWCWAGLQAELDRRGVASYAIDLPGHGASLQPPSDLYGDADSVVSVLKKLGIEDIVLVGHSYGGAVITEAASRATAAGLGNVASLVYISALCLDEGESTFGLLGSLLPEDSDPVLKGIEVQDDGLLLFADLQLAAEAFYNCCDPKVVEAACARLDRQQAVSTTQSASGAPWKSVESTYVICLRDQTLDPNAQVLMASRCKFTFVLDTDHSPFVSRIGDVADILEGIAIGR